MHTFYIPPTQWGRTMELSGQEAHHLGRVLRLHPGDEVRLLDGEGREALCRIMAVGRQSASLEMLSEKKHARPESSVVLAVGWGKEARRGWILEKSVELEADGLWFWQAERSQFPVPSDAKDTWHASLVAGAKQCGNPWLPEIRTLAGGIDEVIRQAKEIRKRGGFDMKKDRFDIYTEKAKAQWGGTSAWKEYEAKSEGRSAGREAGRDTGGWVGAAVLSRLAATRSS